MIACDYREAASLAVPYSGSTLLLPALNPISGDTMLGIGQCHPTGADEPVKLVLKPVLVAPSATAFKAKSSAFRVSIKSSGSLRLLQRTEGRLED